MKESGKINRILPVALCASACASAATICPEVSGASSSAKPDMIVILVDDFGYGDMGAFRKLYEDNYRGPSVAASCTPNLDRLAEEGIRFTRAYTCPWSAPARQMLLSGLWCNRESAHSQPWIGKRLRDQGYVTGMFGKSHGNRSAAKCVFNDAEDTAEFVDGFFFNGGCREAYLKDGESFTGRIGLKPFEYKTKKGEYLTDLISSHALDFIERHAKEDRPFFMYIAHTSPHEPLQGKPEDLKAVFPDKYSGQDDMSIIDGWKRGRDNAEHYAAMVRGVDRTVGDLLETLRDCGRIDNTLIVFASDNGQHRGTSYPLHGHKWELYEGGIRTPLFVWSSGIASSSMAGSVYDGLVSLADIAPTLAALGGEAGHAYPSDGENMAPYVMNGQEKKDKIFFYSGLGRRQHLDDYVYFFGDSAPDASRMMQCVYVKDDEKIISLQSQTRPQMHSVSYFLVPDARTYDDPEQIMTETPLMHGVYPKDPYACELYCEMTRMIFSSGGDIRIEWSGEPYSDVQEWKIPYKICP